MPQFTRVGLTETLALCLGLVIAAAPIPARAQVGEPVVRPLRVLSTSPGGTPSSPVTSAAIQFSEAMVTNAGDNPGSLPFLAVTPEVPIRLSWVATDTLVISPVIGAFPSATPTTIHVSASARSLSGAALAAPVTFSFTTPPVRVTVQGFRRPTDRRGVLVITPSQPLSPAEIRAVMASVRFQPFVVRRTPLGPEARQLLARLDPGAPARHDAALRVATARARLTGRVPVRPLADRHPGALQAGPNDLVVETIGIPPDGTRLVVGPPLPAADDGVSTGPLWQTPPAARRVVRFDDAFRAAASCVAACSPEIAGVQFSGAVRLDAVRAALRVAEIINGEVRPVSPDSTPFWPASEATDFSLRQLGYQVTAGRRYALALERGGVTSTAGRHLEDAWADVVETGLRDPLATVGSRRDAVWEAGLGPALPVISRSLRDVLAGAAAVPITDVLGALESLDRGGIWPGAPAPILARVPVPGDDDSTRITSVDTTPALAANGTGLIWLAVQEGASLPGTVSDVVVRAGRGLPTGTLVQVTNLGLTVRTFPDSVLVFVTALDSGQPMGGAIVRVVDAANQVLWTGETDARGVARTDLGPAALRSGKPALVIVEHGGDRAYAEPISGWSVAPWLDAHASAAGAPLQGVVFTDRGVYRPGDEVKVKAIVRTRLGGQTRPLPAGTPLTLTLDCENERIGVVEGRVGAGGGVEWTVPIPAGAALSSYYTVRVHQGEPEPPAPRWYGPQPLGAALAVKELRPLEFEVAPQLTAVRRAGGGATLDLQIRARDLTGVELPSARVEWRVQRNAQDTFDPPPAYAGFSFQSPSDWDWHDVATGDGVVDAATGHRVAVPVPDGRDGYGLFRAEMTVIDTASSQATTATAQVNVEPGVRIGLRVPPATEGRAHAVQVVALADSGRPVPGLEVALTLRTWGTAGDASPIRFTGVTGTEPVTVALPPSSPAQSYTLEAALVDESRRAPATHLQVWSQAASLATPVAEPASVPVSAPASAPVHVKTLRLTFDKRSYRVGDRARLTLVTPWPASALITVERDRIVALHTFAAVEGARDIEIPIDEAAIGGLSVHAVLVRGRTAACCAESGADPGPPTITTIDDSVAVDPASAHLAVAIDTGRGPVTPGGRLRVQVKVTDHAGRPAPSEVTLWAVDEGWLRHTGYEVAKVAEAILDVALPEFFTWDSRRALLRRSMPDPWVDVVQTSAGARQVETRGGGNDAPVREDMRPLAFWFGALQTDAHGIAAVEATLPDALTTYRVMAVAAEAGRFGQATQPLVVTRPVMVRPALPRLLTRGDRATVRVTVASLLAARTRGTLTVESLTPALLLVEGAPPAVDLVPGERSTVTVGIRALATGTARLRVRLISPEATDAVEHRLPIVANTEIEHYVATGTVTTAAREPITLPADIDGAVGSVSVSLSTSRLDGVALAGRDLDGYGYLCLEQRTSRLIALALAAKEGGPFAFRPIGSRDGGDASRALQRALQELPAFRCRSNGGYGLWGSDCRVSSPYLAAYLLFALQTLEALDVDVDEGELEHATAAVEAALAQPAAGAAGPVHTSDGWRTLAVKVLADAGRFPADEAHALFANRATLPAWAIAHLYDAYAKAAPSDPAAADLRERLLTTIVPSGAMAYVPTARAGFDWTWPSDEKSTAIMLDVLARRGDLSTDTADALATWLLQSRRDGVWHSTQENAWALVALASYRRGVEAHEEAPVEVSADVGSTRLLAARLATPADVAAVVSPTADVLAGLGTARAGAISFTVSGSRPAFYTVRLEMHRSVDGQPPIDRGFAVERRYEVGEGDASRAVTTVSAGDLVRVRVTMRTPQSRFLVALRDPLPAGFEAVDPELASSGSAAREGAEWSNFDHVQLRDGSVDAFATYLPAGEHTFTYLARATTPGTFAAAPPRAEAMYEPEIFGRGAAATIVVLPGR